MRRVIVCGIIPFIYSGHSSPCFITPIYKFRYLHNKTYIQLTLIVALYKVAGTGYILAVQLPLIIRGDKSFRYSPQRNEFIGAAHTGKIL